jgi:DNA-directed RNA polymerase subunit RPC12/RpoP
MEHWTCTTCAKRLGGDDFFEARPGTHDCLSCYKKSLPVCGLCHKEIEGGVQMAEAEGRKFHQSCFVCTVCRVPLQEYHDPDGRYYCKKHFAETFNPKCHACGKAIENTYAQDAEGHKYHTHCFKCAKCGTAIGGGKYFEKNGQIVCPNCK